MDIRKRLVRYFAVSGAFGGVAVVAILVAWLGVRPASRLLFGFEQPALFGVIPLLGALAAGLWASGAPVAGFGALRGAFLGALAFLSVVAVVGLLRGRSLQDSMMFLLVFVLFGFVLIGWAAMLLGALTGWLFKRHTG